MQSDQSIPFARCPIGHSEYFVFDGCIGELVLGLLDIIRSFYVLFGVDDGPRIFGGSYFPLSAIR